ncbi:hypothetical protein [Streptomyces venezuelae]|uniref:hypothetical protein n=1 Tax=Streptomyces venezuelae TaxID=54571 RepID=UPI003429B46B
MTTPNESAPAALAALSVNDEITLKTGEGELCTGIVDCVHATCAYVTIPGPGAGWHTAVQQRDADGIWLEGVGPVDEPSSAERGVSDEEPTRLGSCGPDELTAYVGCHVHGITIGFGIAGHLRAVEGAYAVIVNGHGVHRQQITGLWWLVRPGPFLLNGQPVS